MMLARPKYSQTRFGTAIQEFGFIARTVMACAIVALTSTFAHASDPQTWRQDGWAKTDFSRRSINWDEIISGGPGKDDIPSIDNPKFVQLDGRHALTEREAVIGLEINGDARAYPIAILMWHEIVNDTVGGVPVVITYCPLCNAAIVFDRRTPAGATTFGTTGKLRRSDLVMYDRQTQSWWQQFSGNAIVGKQTGNKLRIVPARLESFASFRARHPKGRVLVPNDRGFRAYGRNPYEGYDTSAMPFLYRGDLPDGIQPMSHVVIVRDAKAPTAITLALLRKHCKIEIADVTLSWRKGQASALDRNTVSTGRDIGNVIAQKTDAKGNMVDVPYDVTFAFVFHAFHPDGSILQKCRAPARCPAPTSN